MAHQTYLQKRGETYRFRLRVNPRSFRYISKREIVVALGTSDRLVARVRCAIVASTVLELLERLRDPLLSDDHKIGLVREFYDQQLKQDWNLRLQAGIHTGARAALECAQESRPYLASDLRRHSAVGERALASWAADDAIARHKLPIQFRIEDAWRLNQGRH
jgi:hypothetical protein